MVCKNFKNISPDLVRSGRTCQANLGVRSCLKKLICPVRLSYQMDSLMGYPEIPQNYWKWRTSVFSELILNIGQEDQTLRLRFLGFDNFKIVANSLLFNFWAFLGHYYRYVLLTEVYYIEGLLFNFWTFWGVLLTETCY